MAQTPSKTVAAKKTAAIPKSMPKPKKAVAAKKTTAKEETKKVVSPKAVAKKEASKPVVKKAGTRTPAASVKGDGEIVKAKKAKKSASASGAVTPEQRYRMICDAAYFRAEQRGFIGGSPEQDWREAELEIDQRLCDMQEAQQNH